MPGKIGQDMAWKKWSQAFPDRPWEPQKKQKNKKKQNKQKTFQTVMFYMEWLRKILIMFYPWATLANAWDHALY